MDVDFHILIKADGAASQLQVDCDPNIHSFKIKCCLGSATISIPKLGDADKTSPNEGWDQNQRQPVLDIGVTSERYYHFRKPISNNKWCADIITYVSNLNTFTPSVPQTYMPASLTPTAHLTNSYKVLVQNTERFRPHTMEFYILAQQHAYSILMDTYVTPSKYSLELYCDSTSTHYTNTPVPLANTANEAPDLVHKMIEPASTYTFASQFIVSNTACPMFKQSIVATAGKVDRDFKSTDATTPVTITSTISDPNLVLNIPFI